MLVSSTPSVAVAQSEATSAPEVPSSEGGPGTGTSAHPIVSASPSDGFGVRSSDGRYSVRFGAILSPRVGLDVSDAGDVEPFARLHLARLLLSGNVLGPHIHYLVGVELTREPYLRDMEMTFECRPELQFRVGRFRIPFSRQFLTSRAVLQLTDRSLVSDFFRAGRGTGLALEGQLFERRAEYRVGVYDAMSGTGPSNGLTAAARLGYAPFGPLALDETTARDAGDIRLAVGLSAYTTMLPRDTAPGPEATAPLERSAGGLDVALRAGPVGLSAEAFLDRRRYADVDDQVGVGAFVQAGVFVVPALLELTGRVGGLAQDPGSASDTSAWRAELGVTYYLLEAGVKLQAGYGYTSVPGVVRDLSATAGHSAQLQAVLAF